MKQFLQWCAFVIVAFLTGCASTDSASSYTAPVTQIEVVHFEVAETQVISQVAYSPDMALLQRLQQRQPSADMLLVQRLAKRNMAANVEYPLLPVSINGDKVMHPSRLAPAVDNPNFIQILGPK